MEIPGPDNPFVAPEEKLRYALRFALDDDLNYTSEARVALEKVRNSLGLSYDVASRIFAEVKAEVLAEMAAWYPVDVDHSLTLKAMVALGEFDFGLRAEVETFPRTPSTGRAVQLKLWSSSRGLKPAEAITMLQRDGFRPATVEELLAFALKYPDIQKTCDVLALGTVASGRIAYLAGSPTHRSLQTTDFDGGWWPRGTKFLVATHPQATP